MRILRLAVLRSYLILSKNIKKAILVINIGIFLSIFATTSAAISFYIEKKISEKEFMLIEGQQTQRDISNIISKFTSLMALMDAWINDETSRESNSSLFSMTDFGDKVLSNKDFYLPVIFSTKREMKYYLELINEKFSYEEDAVTKEITLLEWMVFFIENWDKEDVKRVKAIIDEFKLTVDEMEKINISKNEGTIFHSTYLDLLQEINNSDNNSISNYEHKIYKDYQATMNLNYATISLFREVESVFRSAEMTFAHDIKKLNSEISNLSNLEKNIIFIAFMLQLIIFIIIQFFEITSVHKEIKKKHKI